MSDSRIIKDKMPIRLGDNTMRLTRLFIVAALLVSVFLPVSALAVEETAQTSQMAEKPADAQYPFIAEVIGTNVYVRSGNSQADYHCTKLDAPAKVTVVDEEFGWAKILPPEGCYSWIYKAYVKIEPDNPSVGIVEGENVRVWAGSDDIEAGRSMGLQTKLNKNPDSMDDDDIVDILPNQPETGDYYRIKPPVEAYLWISATFLKYVSPLNYDKPIVVPPRPDTQDDSIAIPPSNEQARPQFTNLNGPTEEQTQAPVKVEIKEEEEKGEEPKQQPAPKLTARENELLKQCYDLSAKIDEELKKPLNDQDYTEIKKQLVTIQEDTDAGKAATHAQFLSERIQRYELAKSVTEILQKQDEQLEQAKQNIEKAYQVQLNQIPEEAQFLYTGTLKPSHVYTSKTGSKRYLLLDANGKILCYLVAASPVIEAQLLQKENMTVGINGTIASNQKSLVSLVAVTELASIK